LPVLQRSATHRALHSFPTRRSSDLSVGHIEPRALRPALAECLRRFDPAVRPALAARNVRPVGVGVVPVGDAVQKHARLSLVSISDRKSTRLNSSHVKISYAVFCLKK